MSLDVFLSLSLTKLLIVLKFWNEIQFYFISSVRSGCFPLNVCHTIWNTPLVSVLGCHSAVLRLLE